MEPKSTEKRILLIALGKEPEKFLRQNLGSIAIDTITSEDELEPLFDILEDIKYDFIVCGCALGVNFPLEVGQLFSQELPDTPLVFFGDKLKSVRIDELTKNGFSKFFLYPIDSNLILKELSSYIGEGLKQEVMIPVRTFDLIPGETTPFALYIFLPLNRKFIRLIAEEKLCEVDTINKLERYEFKTLFVKSKDYEKLSQLGAQKIRTQLGCFKINPSEKNLEAIKESVRSMTMSLFDIPREEKFDPILALEESLDAVLECLDAKNVVESFKNNLLSSFDHYEFTKVRAVLASLLAMSLRLKTSKELLIAGFLQDVSLWKFDPALTIDELMEADKEWVMKHPKKSLTIANTKLGGLSKNVCAIIEQHHERFDGKGFPEGLRGSEVLVEAQIMNFVNQLEELSRLRKGKKKYTFQESLSFIQGNGSISHDLEEKIYDVLDFNPKAAPAQAI